MKNNSIIHSLFALPIYISNIERQFTKKELDFVYKQEKKCVKNEGNVNTADNYILNNKEFKNIKQFLEKSCQDYLDKIISPEKNIKLYITQSWLNYTKENQFHHRHAHPNSVVSGVLYFNANEENDSIKFFNKDTYAQLLPKIKNYNIWNSFSWWFPIKTGSLIMFPSSTTHQVDLKKGDNNRISLAFNTFYKGTLGENESLTELIL